jgi:Asp-tRNA(Asn)/Glu-tRNA(Gln) amidotransferase B subunit
VRWCVDPEKSVEGVPGAVHASTVRQAHSLARTVSPHFNLCFWIIDNIIAGNPGQIEQYRSGKDKVFAFLVGQVMKEM